MILAFKEQFKEPILKGTKIHTIRVDKNNQWSTGKKIHFATGVRTKDQKTFKEGRCKSTQNIVIRFEKDEEGWGMQLFIDGLQGKGDYWFDDLPLNDGFKKFSDFYDFFLNSAVEMNPLQKIFTGKIIHFTEFRY